MKNLILALTLVFGLTTFAQQARMSKEKRDNLTTPEKVEAQVKRLTSELGLNEKQSVQIKTLMTKKAELREATKKMREEKRASGTRPTAEERETMRTKMQNEYTSLKTEMKSILNAEQYTKWEQNIDDKKDKMIEKRTERREKKSRN